MHPRNLFRISRATRAEVRNVFVQITADGISGFGEASPNAFYGESANDVCDRLHKIAPRVAQLPITSPEDIARAWQLSWKWLAPSRAAQCALDLALWDWLARLRGVSVTELALGTPPHPVRTFCTIGISDPLELEAKVHELRGFPLIKLKSDARADLAPARYIREHTQAKLAIDANCAWGNIDIAALAPELTRLGVLFIEQPLPPADDTRMPALLARSPLPLLADESCVTLDDIERIAGYFSAFNIKLVKCGGLTPALAMAKKGHELGLRTMTGCMLESSLLIAAGAVVAQLTDYADLDGAWLLGDDPFQGCPLKEGILYPAAQPDFGVAMIPGSLEF